MYPRSIARRLDTSARRPQSRAVLRATRDLVLPTTITGSYPRPQWFVEELRGRGFKDALGDSRFREQYLDAVACLVREQEMAGLDIVTDGDSRFDLTVGGKSRFFYVIERLRSTTSPAPTAPPPTRIWSFSPRPSTGRSRASTPRSGCTPAGAIPTSSRCTGSGRPTSARCRTCWRRTPTC